VFYAAVVGSGWEVFLDHEVEDWILSLPD